MTKTQEPALESALRLRHDPALAPFVEWLKERREQARNACEGQSGEALLRAQGRAQELKEVLNFIETAPAVLEKQRGR